MASDKITYEQIIADIQKKIYKPVYFLMGEEPYFIDKITEYIINNVLSPDERDFNQTIVYGKDMENAAAVINLARRYPMMSNYQVVVVKEAQNIKKLEDDLIYYVENPMKSTILVINYKYDKIDGRKKIGKAIEKNGVLFDSKKIYDNQVPGWITSFLKKDSYTISPMASQLLADFLGNDLGKIVNELEKLIITLPAGFKEITPDHIEKNIGISKDYNVFELNSALSVKDALKANRIINHFSKNPNEYPLVKTMTAVFMHFNRILIYHSLPDKSDNKNVASLLGIHPFFLSEYKTAAKNYSYAKTIDVISILREYDMKSKGVDNISTSDLGLMKELVYKIIH
ncbi:MAG: DNA polymerase III subunit delta [Bacteroidia bacterium]|nr:DNA polymerase III subunit delta [Bacteroidia bacterium]